MNPAPQAPTEWDRASWVNLIPFSPIVLYSGYSKTMKPVALQIKIVSTNTPKACNKPCFTGWDTFEVAAAFGALPIPASLEYSPLLIPCNIATPIAPPTACFIPKAASMILINNAGIWIALTIKTYRATTTYPIAIIGTMKETTLAILFNPPKMIKAVRAAKIIPATAELILNVVSKAWAIVLAWTVLNTNANVTITITEKM